MDTFLDKVQDPVLFLQIFTCRVRSGLLAHNGEPVRSRTAEAYLRAGKNLEKWDRVPYFIEEGVHVVGPAEDFPFSKATFV